MLAQLVCHLVCFAQQLTVVVALGGMLAAVSVAEAASSGEQGPSAAPPVAPHAAEAMFDEDGSLQIWQPSASLLPRQVVQRQLAALQAGGGQLGNRENGDALLQCFVLASPANRAVTGPIERFSGMLQTPAYRPLVSMTTAMVGKAVVKGDQATVLVTLLDSDARVSAYRFYLSKQTAAPYRNCWMTDSVILQPAVANPVPAEPAPLSEGSGVSWRRTTPHAWPLPTRPLFEKRHPNANPHLVSVA